MPQPRLTFACELSSERLDDLFADGSITAAFERSTAGSRWRSPPSPPSALGWCAGSTMRVSRSSASLFCLLMRVITSRPTTSFGLQTVTRSGRRGPMSSVWPGMVSVSTSSPMFAYSADRGQPVGRHTHVVAADLPVAPPEACGGGLRRAGRAHPGRWLASRELPVPADGRRTPGLSGCCSDLPDWWRSPQIARSRCCTPPSCALWAPGMIWSYGPAASAIAVGSTGGAPDIPGHPQVPSLGWDELERDLLLASRFSDDLYIHSCGGLC